MDNYGDINKDGKINIIDINQVIKIFKGIQKPSSNELVSVDFDSNNIINVVDINNVIKLFKGVPVETKGVFSLHYTSQENTLSLRADFSQMKAPIGGIQLYIKGIQLENKTTKTGYLSPSEKNELLRDWIVATNNIKDDISIVYLETNSETNQLQPNIGSIELCKIKYNNTINDIKFYSDDEFTSQIVEITDNDVIEHKFLQNLNEKIY